MVSGRGRVSGGGGPKSLHTSLEFKSSSAGPKLHDMQALVSIVVLRKAAIENRADHTSSVEPPAISPLVAG